MKEILTKEEINFYLRDDEYGWLSNFHRARQMCHGIEYPTNEHFYQSMMAEQDSDVARWIASAPTPFLAMCAGRSLRKGKEMRKFLTEGVKIAFMHYGLFSKFNQNKKLKQKLLDTGVAILHEDSPTDMFWGKKGKDMLGRLLMRVRKELRDRDEVLAKKGKME